MRCHYVYDDISGKNVLIPGCWSVVHSDDIEDCTCKTTTFHQFEKDKYNQVIKEKDSEIEDLYETIKRLNARLKYWQKRSMNKNASEIKKPPYSDKYGQKVMISDSFLDELLFHYGYLRQSLKSSNDYFKRITIQNKIEGLESFFSKTLKLF